MCGVDLSKQEVLHAREAHTMRLERRKSGGHTLAPTTYHVGDMEALPFPDESFDVSRFLSIVRLLPLSFTGVVFTILFYVCKRVLQVVISNGGFCLVPDKSKAFSEVARVLKPGGRCAIACTVNKVQLDPKIKWPACMEVSKSVCPCRSTAHYGASNFLLKERFISSLFLLHLLRRSS